MNVIWLHLVTTVFTLLALVDKSFTSTNNDENSFAFFPPPESPLDCPFEDDFCGWHPAGTDYFQWQRRGYIGNLTKDLYKPSEGYLSYKYVYVDSNLCVLGKTSCQAALVSVPIILNASSSSPSHSGDVNPVSSSSSSASSSFSSSSTSNSTYGSSGNTQQRADWCFEFYYFITNNRSSHTFDIDVYVDKPPDISPGSSQHSVVVSEQPEWSLSRLNAENPLSMAAGYWRHATVNIQIGAGMHQLTVLAHLTKSSPNADSPNDQVVIAIDNSRLYKGKCVDLFEQDILTMTYSPEDPALAGQVLNAAVLNDMNLWPRGIIPYAISSDFTSSEYETIQKSMKEFEKATCIRFRLKSAETNYLDITKGSWCYSFAGRVLRPEKQPLALHSSCLNFGTVLHELNHAVGFYHEHSRYDRDDYVSIQWDNIAPGSNNQFQKYTLDQVDHLGLPYDYESVMHYSRTAYARLPGLTTIEPKQKGYTIGQRERLSELDVRKINKKYKCPDGTNPIDQPTTSLSCAFEVGFCGWTQPGEADTQWMIFDPNQAHFEAPVSSAASTNGMADIGRRAAVVDLTGAIDVVRLTSPVAYTSGCFSFSFFFSRTGRKALRIILVDANSSETVVWHLTDNGDSHSIAVWRRGKFDIPLSNFRIAVEADPLGNGHGSIAVDDFNFTASHSDCSFMPIEARPTVSASQTASMAFELNCTFERSDFCGWINVRQVDEFDWILNSGRTLTPFTGPAFDHTLGANNPWGIYAYAPAVNKSPGNTARLVSPALTGYSSICLRFWYHMYGNAMGTLRVYKRLIGGRTPGDVLSWEISGNQGTAWHTGDVRMAGVTDEVFQLVFEATVGQGAQSDMAVDDISVTFDDACSAASPYSPPDDRPDSNNGGDSWSGRRGGSSSTPRSASLTSGQFLLPTSSRASISRTIGRVTSYGLNPYTYQTNRERGTTKSQASNQQILFCNFDSSNVCSWVQDETQDDFEWQLNRGLTPSRNTGPMADHTTGSSAGYYLYLEASSPRRIGDLARLKSPLITNQPLTGCFRFWYSMYGSGIGELRILSTSAADGSRRLLWRLVGEQGPDWLRGQVWVDLEPSGGKIFIEGIVGQSYLADIAIDDLSFTAENCETLPQHAGMMPDDDQVAYSRQSQLSPSDEQRDSIQTPKLNNAIVEAASAPIKTLSICSFVVGSSCGWSFAKDGDAYWYHSRSYPLQGTTSPNRHPDYIYVMSDWLQPWRSVSLISPSIDYKTPACFRLSYFMTSASDSMSIKMKFDDGSEEAVTTVGSGALGSPSSASASSASSSNEYPEWKQMNQTLFSVKTGSFKVVIFMQHGQAWNGAIGLESAEVSSGRCV